MVGSINFAADKVLQILRNTSEQEGIKRILNTNTGGALNLKRT